MEQNKNEVFRLFMMFMDYNGVGVTLSKIQKEIGYIYNTLRKFETMALLVKNNSGKWFMRDLPKIIFKYILEHQVTEDWLILKNIKHHGYEESAVEDILDKMVEINLLRLDDGEYMINRRAYSIEKGSVKDEISQVVLLILSKGSTDQKTLLSILDSWGTGVYGVLKEMVSEGIILLQDGIYSIPGVETIKHDKIEKETVMKTRGETRREILNLIKGGVIHVEDLADKLGMAYNSIYYHLNKLQEEGLIKKEEGFDGTTYIGMTYVSTSPELGMCDSPVSILQYLIAEILSESDKTVNELISATGSTRNELRYSLKRMIGQGTITKYTIEGKGCPCKFHLVNKTEVKTPQVITENKMPQSFEVLAQNLRAFSQLVAEFVPLVESSSKELKCMSEKDLVEFEAKIRADERSKTKQRFDALMSQV